MVTLYHREQQPATKFQLLSFPDEILLCIVDAVDAHKDLCNIAAACSRLRDLAEPTIWQSLLIRTGGYARTVAHAFKRRPERVSAIKELSIRYGEEDQEGIEDLDPFLYDMSRLRHLTIESPCPNNHGGGNDDDLNFQSCTRINYDRLFEQAVKVPSPPLAMLQSVTLHGHRGSRRPFDSRGAAFLFFHPTLRHLTISCTNLDASNYAAMKFSDLPADVLKSTALQSLTLIECNIYLDFLEVALSLPKALKELSISERLHAWGQSIPNENRPRTTNAGFLDILQKQASSLERLVYCPGSKQWQAESFRYTDGPSKLQNLRCLKHLEVDCSQSVYYCLKEGGYPPSLSTLKLTDASLAAFLAPHAMYGIFTPAQIMDELVHSARDLAITSNPAPIQLDINLSHYSNPYIHIHTWTSDRAVRMIIYEMAAVLMARGARLRIFAQANPTNPESHLTLIPPYMLGEEQPVEISVYDSDRGLWTIAGKNYQALDERELPRDFAATCVACKRMGTGSHCANSGYGTRCVSCREAGAKCEYAPPASPWVARPVE